jgi:hypothetical protein
MTGFPKAALRAEGGASRRSHGVAALADLVRIFATAASAHPGEARPPAEGRPTARSAARYRESAASPQNKCPMPKYQRPLFH